LAITDRLLTLMNGRAVVDHSRNGMPTRYPARRHVYQAPPVQVTLVPGVSGPRVRDLVSRHPLLTVTFDARASTARTTATLQRRNIKVLGEFLPLE
jgi:hypothetical protein